MAKKRGAPNASRSLTLEQLSSFFHRPINEVAVELGICVTVLKQRCREFGITRWPFRKVRKLDAIITALESSGGKSGGDAAALLVSAGEGAAAGPQSTVASAEATERLATVKQTRELLLQNPNSTAHLHLGKAKSIRKPAAGSADEDGEDSLGHERPSRPRRAAAPSAPAPLPMAPPMPHSMMPPGMEGGASIEDAQRNAMLAYAAYSSASAFSNAAAMYHHSMAGGAVAGLPRPGSAVGIDGSGPIRPIATSGSFSNALAAAAAATAAGGGAEAALCSLPAASPSDSADAAAAEAGAPPAAASAREPSPPSRGAEGADVSGGAAMPHNPPGGPHLFFPVGGLGMLPPMGHPMSHPMGHPMMPMVGPMAMWPYGPGYANMPASMHMQGMQGMPGIRAGMSMVPWPHQPHQQQPQQPQQPR